VLDETNRLIAICRQYGEDLLLWVPQPTCPLAGVRTVIYGLAEDGTEGSNETALSLGESIRRYGEARLSFLVALFMRPPVSLAQAKGPQRQPCAFMANIWEWASR
jgi:hypothetical protein